MASFPLHLRNLLADNETVVVEDNCSTQDVSHPLAFATLAALAPQQKSHYFRRRCRWESAPAVTTASYRVGNSDRAPVLKGRVDPSISGMYSLYSAMKPMSRCPPPESAPISKGPSTTACVGVDMRPDVDTRQSNFVVQENLDQVLLFSQALQVNDDL